MVGAERVDGVTPLLLAAQEGHVGHHHHHHVALHHHVGHHHHHVGHHRHHVGHHHQSVPIQHHVGHHLLHCVKSLKSNFCAAIVRALLGAKAKVDTGGLPFSIFNHQNIPIKVQLATRPSTLLANKDTCN